MFCANTRPRPDATTDLGVIGPVIVWSSRSVRVVDGGPVVVVVGGIVVVEVVGAVVAARAGGRVRRRADVVAPAAHEEERADAGRDRDRDRAGTHRQPLGPLLPPVAASFGPGHHDPPG